MQVIPRPTGLASFISRQLGPGSALLGATVLLSLSGCPAASPQPGKADAKQAAGKGPAPAAGADTKQAPPATTAAPPAADASCCRYCFVGTPCGDECTVEGETCDKPEGEGCACTKDKRVAREFRKGFRLPPKSGLIGPDVFNYNKSQGDPIDGPFTLEMAFEGEAELADASKGKLTAVFETSMGTFECELYEHKAPLTVANFVGLARGVRPFLDPRDRKSEEWKKAPYYDGTIFHRVIKDFMLQGGDPTAMGVGTPGYFIPDEFDPELRHKGPGFLSMANRNPYDPRTNKPIYDDETGLTVGNTGSAQFFVTVRDTMALNDRHTIFGFCPDPTLPIEMSKVRTQSQPIPDKPFEDIVINKLSFKRQ
ncbi:peptidylprolyl isomerase [Enhygromyxa salina]|uniref:peptidylprolyl isomerase n=1 Tax=Enhygromyxa salina TaxID=215803 RepID=A0A2S9XYB5_9BACT|nr:peptidylprolyl isomerase [Enhygromyxa salina]PRP97852.1 putative peptidyl-prolyl cis-trans isomerase [Enhygromyxa salina]